MDETPTAPSVAKIAIVSSLLTLLIIGGLVFSARTHLVSYLKEELSNNNPEILAPAAADEDTLVSVIDEVNDAVVSVIITKNVPVYEQYYDTFDPWGVFAIPRVRENGTVEQEVGGGSGFIVSSDGLIVTNNHVVADTDATYSIVLIDGFTYTVDVLARDPQLDIAIIKINQPIEHRLPYLSFGDSGTLRLGQTVIAIGNALSEFQNSVSVGVVSGLSRTIVASDGFGRSEQLDQVIQTDAAINPGNSGGPLLDIKGKVIGVNVATSRGAENIGFALPANVVKQVVDSVRQYGEIVRPFIGIRYTMVTPRLVKANSLPVDYGALVIGGEGQDEAAVLQGSPADKAGITQNDIILSIDGEELKNKDLSTILRTKAVGQQITLKVLHEGGEKEVKLTLEKASN